MSADTPSQCCQGPVGPVTGISFVLFALSLLTNPRKALVLIEEGRMEGEETGLLWATVQWAAFMCLHLVPLGPLSRSPPCLAASPRAVNGHPLHSLIGSTLSSCTLSTILLHTSSQISAKTLSLEFQGLILSPKLLFFALLQLIPTCLSLLFEISSSLSL